MKTYLKKLTALLLTLLLALSLAACGGTDGDDDESYLADFTPMTGWTTTATSSSSAPTRAPTTTGRGTAGWASARSRSWTTGP